MTALTGEYRKLAVAVAEYPLLSAESATKCPTARYVGGVMRWVCECEQPTRCPGVMAAQEAFNATQAD